MRTSSGIKTYILSFVAVFLMFAPLTACAEENSPFEPLEIHSEAGDIHKFQVEIADEQPEHEIGLMFRTEMKDENGMFFIFDDVRERAFWMKNTLIPLDILYINEYGRVGHIHKNAVPKDLTPLPSFIDAKAALEINGGLADELGLKVGDYIIHPVF